MSAWRRQALDLLPEHREVVEAAESPMALWIELHFLFEDTVARGDWKSVGRFLKLAAWCVSEDSGPLPNDTSTAAAVAFYEHLPEDRTLWKYFPSWFSRREFESLLPVFAYHLDDNELEQLKQSYAPHA
jgi:hypothetical protein